MELWIQLPKRSRVETTKGINVWHSRKVWPGMDHYKYPALKMNDYTGPVELDSIFPRLPPNIITVSAWCDDNENMHSLVRPASKFADTSVPPKEQQEKKPSIMVIGIDAVSRSQFMRQMQETVKALEEVGHHSDEEKTDFRLFQFFRYNTIGRGTAGNLKPFLYGPTIRSKYVKGESMWERFEGQGYATAHFYDLCAFHNELLPVYVDPDKPEFHLPDHWHLFGCRVDLDNYGYYNNFKGPFSLMPKCAGNRLVHDLMIDGLEDMWSKYDKLNVPRWGFSWTNHAHEGSGAILSTLDPRLSQLVRTFGDPTTRHIYEDTILVIMSDHGNRMGMLDLDDVIRRESNMPSLFILVPSKFLAGSGTTENLLHNEQALVTVADLRKTLLSVSGGFDSETSSLDPEVGVFKDTYDLFHSKVPHDRTCVAAGIPKKHCACFPC